MIFHVFVFILYGFLFWTWILLDAALLLVLLWDLKARIISIYGRGHLLISVVLIGFASHWVNPPHLAWFDLPLAYNYRIDAVTADGARYRLPPRFFAPFEETFTMTSFAYLPKDRGVLAGPYGVTLSREIADALAGPITPEEVFKLEVEIASRRHDPKRAAQLYDFLTRYARNWNEKHEVGAAIYAFRTPPQFWSFHPGEIPPPDAIIRELIVTEVTTLFDGKQLETIREQEMARLQILSTPAQLEDKR